MRWPILLGAAGAAALGVRITHSRHRRFLHPIGRSFAGELEIWATPHEGTGADLLDRPGRHPVTVRISKGAGTPPGWPDVLGVAVRVHGPGHGQVHDLLLSTAGRGRLSRHLPTLRRSFDTWYGSILPYRTGGPPGRKIYLAVLPDPDGGPLGHTLDAVTAAAQRGGARLLLGTPDSDGLGNPDSDGLCPLGRITIGAPLPAADDAELAFDPVRNTTPDLRPTGLVHASRAWAYPLGQRWRRAQPAASDLAAVTRTAAHR